MAIDPLKVIAKKNRIVLALDRDIPLKQVQNLYIEYVLETVGGNKVKASRILGIDRRTIQRFVKKLTLPPPQQLPEESQYHQR